MYFHKDIFFPNVFVITGSALVCLKGLSDCQIATYTREMEEMTKRGKIVSVGRASYKVVF